MKTKAGMPINAQLVDCSRWDFKRADWPARQGSVILATKEQHNINKNINKNNANIIMAINRNVNMNHKQTHKHNITQT